MSAAPLWTRRRALAASCVGCAGALLGGCAGLPTVPARLDGARLAFDAAALAEHRCVGLAHPQLRVPLAVCRLDDGGLSAVAARCTHKGCNLKPAGNALACPCHDSSFALTGEVLGGPARKNLQRFDVRQEGLVIYVGA